MNRNDWIGLSTSVLLHVVLIAAFAFMTAAAPEPQQIGFIEVELGPMSSGRPVQQGRTNTPVEPVERPQPEQEEQTPKAAPPRDAKPVELPEQELDLPDQEAIEAPETEKVAPEAPNEPADVISERPQPEAEAVQPLGSGARDGTAGAATGTQGQAADETKAAPFQIEGLNRDAVFAPLPPYREKVNATIRFRITVSPRGQITSAVPVLKANPALESAVRDVLLQRWRFNPLPPNAPQENQIGTVTFQFRLE